MAFVPALGAVPWPNCMKPATVPPAPAVNDPGVLKFPEESRVAVALGVWIVCDPPPVTKAVLVRVPAPTTVTVPDPPPPAAGAQHFRLALHARTLVSEGASEHTFRAQSFLALSNWQRPTVGKSASKIKIFFM